MNKSLAEIIVPLAVRNCVRRTLSRFITQRADKNGVASYKTQHERLSTILLMVAQLWELGYRIQKLESLCSKHVQALMNYWHKNGLSPSMLHTRLSMLRVLCRWLGKANVVKDITDYLPAEAVRRCNVAHQSRAWEAHQVDPLEMIELAKQVDERFAVMLAMQHHFGLRVKESIEFRPANAVVECGSMLEVHEGTKGGRVRRVPIDSREKDEVLEWAQRVAASGKSNRLRWEDCTFRQAQSRFYHYARYRLGISAATLGVTPHGLRHGYAQRDYQRQTGLPTPIEGGAIGKIDRATHRMASLTTSRALGHGRTDVTTSYNGSYGHQLRTAPVTMTYKLNLKK